MDDVLATLGRLDALGWEWNCYSTAHPGRPRPRSYTVWLWDGVSVNRAGARKTVTGVGGTLVEAMSEALSRLTPEQRAMVTLRGES